MITTNDTHTITTCDICAHAISENHDGICDVCDIDVCQDCQPEGNTCTHCVEELASEHIASIARADDWARLTDDQREDRIRLEIS